MKKDDEVFRQREACYRQAAAKRAEANVDARKRNEHSSDLCRAWHKGFDNVHFDARNPNALRDFQAAGEDDQAQMRCLDDKRDDEDREVRAAEETYARDVDTCDKQYSVN
jgi:hypothetical protein